ncbi:MAG: L,D-transpeptidase family protein [Bauldia sp.]
MTAITHLPVPGWGWAGRGLRSLTVGAVCGLMLAGAAVAAGDPISQVLQNNSAEWSDGFDPASAGADIRTSTPILSPQIVGAVEQAIAQYSQIVAQGGWPVVPSDRKLKLGIRSPAVSVLRQRLAISGDMARSNGYSDIFDTYVDQGVRRFQKRHGIFGDGIVGDSTLAALNIPAVVRLNQLSNNMTRLKGLTAKLPNRFVMVNIPGAQVEAVENGSVVSRHTAVVGKVDRPSPTVNSRITDINFNPFWTVPVSIIKRDLIPLMQKNPNYLTEYNIRIYDPKGNELQPEQVNWMTDEATKYMFRQDPGDENSLGTVKINFPSPDGVYMHDTPHKGLFNSEFRFDSSGCVRIQNIRELINWLLRDTPQWSREQIDAMFRTGQRMDAKLAAPVPLFWIYVTAWATEEGVVHFRNDIYGYDGLDQFAEQTAATTPVAAPALAPAN